MRQVNVGDRIRLISMPDDPERRAAAGNVSRVIRKAHWRDEPRDASSAKGDTTRRHLPAQVLRSEDVVVAVMADFMPQIEVRWDSGRTLYLLPDIDSFEIIAMVE